VYETIKGGLSNSTPRSPTYQPISIVDSNTASVYSQSEEATWDEHGSVVLRNFYALRNETVEIVTERKISKLIRCAYL